MKQQLTRAWKIARSQFRDSTFTEFVSTLLKSLFRVEGIIIYERNLYGEIANPIRNDMYGSITKGDVGELEHARKAMQLPCWEFCCDLYDGVKDFFLCRINGDIGHISWIYYKNDPNRIIDLGDKECEVKFCLTSPQYRGKGIYPAVLVRIQDYLREKGYSRVFVCVKKDNLPSKRGIEKAGFSPVSEVKIIKLMGMQVSKRYDSRH